MQRNQRLYLNNCFTDELCFIIGAPEIDGRNAIEVLIVEDDRATRMGLQELLARRATMPLPRRISAPAAGHSRGAPGSPHRRSSPGRLQRSPAAARQPAAHSDHHRHRLSRRRAAGGSPSARRRYLVKPVDPAELLAPVGRLLDCEPRAPERRRGPRKTYHVGSAAGGQRRAGPVARRQLGGRARLPDSTARRDRACRRR